MTRNIAVIDIGKTNVKLALVDGSTLSEITVITQPNTVIPGPPWPHFDVDCHWAFVLEGLRAFNDRYGLHAISITTHGACVALLDYEGNLVAPILDYEHAGPDEVAQDYDRIRPSFSETGSPRLAGGLNVGAQLFWQFKIDPDLKSRTQQIVTYPQFWGAKLTGVTAMDVTSLGCHTDLWNPHSNRFSSLVATLGIAGKLAPVGKPFDVLGPVLPSIATQTGLPPDTPVHCGIHDSNASLLPHVLGNTPPFSVVSTGTWVIAMSIGGKQVQLDPALDALINVTALGQPAPSARFMGGREYDIASGDSYPQPTSRALETVLSSPIMLLPAVVPDTGPFKGHISRWVGPEPNATSGERATAVALYLALVTAECLINIGHDGPIIVEGPFAGNQLYLEMLSVAAISDLYRSAGTTGTSIGAALLASGASSVKPTSRSLSRVRTENAASLRNYALSWRHEVSRQSV